MRAILKTWSNLPFMYPNRQLAREEGTTSIKNSQLGRSRFGYFMYMGFPGKIWLNCESKCVKSFSGSLDCIFEGDKNIIFNIWLGQQLEFCLLIIEVDLVIFSQVVNSLQIIVKRRDSIDSREESNVDRRCFGNIDGWKMRYGVINIWMCLIWIWWIGDHW